MALNLNKIKKWMGILMAGFIPSFLVILFFLFRYPLLLVLVAWIVGVIASAVIFSIITRHPLNQLIEGQGLLVLKVDSTGVIQPFIAKVAQPFIKTTINGEEKTSLYDRESVFYLNAPINAILTKVGLKKKETEGEKTEVQETVPINPIQYETFEVKYEKGQEQDITFGFGSFPCLIWNGQLDCFYTKSAFSKLEVDGIVKHMVLYLKKKTEELTSLIRDFARYVVELTKPKAGLGDLMGKWWFWLIAIVVVVMLVVMVLPLLGKTGGAALPSTPVIPR